MYDPHEGRSCFPFTLADLPTLNRRDRELMLGTVGGAALGLVGRFLLDQFLHAGQFAKFLRI
jgi:hypothetical protein